MRRLIIGLCLAALGAPAHAQTETQSEGGRLLATAIAAARSDGPLGFRLRCEAGCERPRRTLANLEGVDVTGARRGACRGGRGECWILDLERKAPTRWFSVEIEPGTDASRPIARVVIVGP